MNKRFIVSLAVILLIKQINLASASPATISVINDFILDGFTVTPTIETGGTVAPNTQQEVNERATKAFTVTPNTGYIRNNTVGGTCPPGSWNGNVWTTGAILEDCIVSFSFTAQPDFVITAINLTPTSPPKNSVFTATVIVKNQGAIAGNVGWVDVWINQSSVLDCGTDGDQWKSFGSLDAGASTTLTFTAFAAGSTAGNRLFRAFVDSFCNTEESDESNNQFTKSYVVQ